MRNVVTVQPVELLPHPAIENRFAMDRMPTGAMLLYVRLQHSGAFQKNTAAGRNRHGHPAVFRQIFFPCTYFRIGTVLIHRNLNLCVLVVIVYGNQKIIRITAAAERILPVGQNQLPIGSLHTGRMFFPDFR